MRRRTERGLSNWEAHPGIGGARHNARVKIPRLWEDVGGTSHFDDVDVEMSSPPVSLSKLMEATGIVFMGADGNTVMEAHRGPRRQFMIVLEGEWECTAGDGERHGLMRRRPSAARGSKR